MPKLPSVGCRKVVKAFKSFVWEVARQASSHIVMTRDGSSVTLSVPARHPVAKGTLRSLIRASGLTVEEFVRAL
jgi:predicted RNA binding protein YcfA (HicA-like mRNA interferase family)